ncbi:MAG: Gfo/Idh/MocA family protein [Planctomycetota bacterium]|jgi:predicted dehydrogenase
MNKENQNSEQLTRRNFVKSTASALAGFTIVPSYVLAASGQKPPSEKLNIAFIGVGGQGERNIGSLSGENIVALCDVDQARAAKMYESYPDVPRYKDFRKMLDKQKNIDAVVVTTPDHSHAVAAMTTIKMKKHLFCEKPLTYSIYEARKLTEAARNAKIATQMGIHHHAGGGTRMAYDVIRADMIGNVREVHLWTVRPRQLWAQGVGRPQGTPPVPSTLDWDLWLGPAPKRPYNPAYVPFTWRGWWDFGTGALGNMGCHVMDLAFWALDLGKRSVSVEARTSWVNDETYPAASIVRYEFGPLGDSGPLKVFWYDGGMLPWRPPQLEPKRRLPSHGGIYVGEKETIMVSLGDGPRLIPETKMKGFKKPERTLPQSPGLHAEWVNACKGGPEALANFDYSGPLTETVLLGNIAIKAKQKITWDSKNMKITNLPEANEHLHRKYRQGWSL